MNTSKALGISVYEDFPVEFNGEDNSAKSKGIIYSDYSTFGEMRDIPIPDLPKQARPAQEAPKSFTNNVRYWG
jgi:hypothetical protein